MAWRLRHLKASFLVLTALIAVSAQAQTGALSGIFTPVNASLRQRLSGRLKMYVEYQRTHQWGRLYNMTAKQFREKETREEFAKRQASLSGYAFPETLDFVPHYTVTSYYGIEGNYSIEGCMKVRLKGRTHSWQAGVEAFWEDGEWYFSSISAITGLDTPPRPCRKMTRK